MYDVRAVRYCKHCGEDLLRRERPYCKFCNSPFERQILISTSVLAPTPIVNRSYSVANGQELVWFVYGKSHDGEEISLEHPLRDEAERKWRSIWTSRYLLQFGSCRTHNEESLQYDEAIVKRWLDEVRDTAVMKSGDDLEPVVPEPEEPKALVREPRVYAVRLESGKVIQVDNATYTMCADIVPRREAPTMDEFDRLYTQALAEIGAANRGELVIDSASHHLDVLKGKVDTIIRAAGFRRRPVG